MMNDSELLYVGVDVGKNTLDVALGVHGTVERYENDSTGHDLICQRLAGITDRPVGLIPESVISNSPHPISQKSCQYYPTIP